MKRSEMIDIMVEAGDSEFVLTLKHIAERMLKTMEEEGILPPINNHELYMDGDNADEKSIIYRTWEKEVDE